jgi:hypothetical protein
MALDKQLALAETLLKAAYDLLEKCDASPYIVDALGETVFYDEAECDGLCLKDDINNWFEEFSLSPQQQENDMTKLEELRKARSDAIAAHGVALEVYKRTPLRSDDYRAAYEAEDKAWYVRFEATVAYYKEEELTTLAYLVKQQETNQ